MAMTLFGVETEFGFAILDRQGKRVDADEAIHWLMTQARAQLPYLADNQRLFLQNGALLYIDCGDHPELTTPECTTPDELVAYLRAGEQMLAGIVAELERHHDVSEARLFKCNVDYMNETATWGCHESYLYRRRRTTLARQLIPHLLSRLIYTGSGGFNNQSSGIEFSLSPRVFHLNAEVADNSIRERGIFHTKNESLCGKGFRRLHIICGDSNYSELANWLKVGTTALVVAMIDAGLQPGKTVQLSSPVAAMHLFAADPECKAEADLAGGGTITALAIQRHYLELAQTHVDAPFMPPWTKEVCRRWRKVLEQLTVNPESIHSGLDWPIKLALFKERARQAHDIPWETIQAWTILTKQIRQLARKYDENPRIIDSDFIRKHSALGGENGRLFDELFRLLRVKGFSEEKLAELNALRFELFELDTRFGELGPRGIFSALENAGLLNHRVLSDGVIEHAVINPPTVGRARIRGECIRRLAAQKNDYRCNWQGIIGQERMLDLSDPFETVERWREVPQDSIR